MRVALFFTLLALTTVTVSAQWRFLSTSTSDAAVGWQVTKDAAATTGTKNLAITATAGTNVTLSIETGVAHPFGFFTDNTDSPAVVAVPAFPNAACTNNTNAWYSTNVGTPCIVVVTVPAAGTTWTYKCTQHYVNMKGQFTSAAASTTGASSSSSTGGSTVVSSSSSAGTTPAPTKSNNTASVAMPALTVVLATITAAAIVA